MCSSRSLFLLIDLFLFLGVVNADRTVAGIAKFEGKRKGDKFLYLIGLRRGDSSVLFYS